MMIAPQVGIEIIETMSLDEATAMTRDIRSHLSQARDKILRMYQSEGYRAMGYDSFKAWAQGEFEMSWQQVYNLKAAAEYSGELTLFSPTGDVYEIPVNHARQLRKLKSAERRVRAYHLAEEQAKAQGETQVTETIVQSAVGAVQAEEIVMESGFTVVRQMLANEELTAKAGKQIVDELNKLDDEPAQAFVQKLMAKHKLSNPDLIYPLGYKHKNERKRGKESKVLDEVERTGRLAGALLSEATVTHLQRANEEAKNGHIADAEEMKRKQLQLLHEQDPENNPPPPQQIAITIWKHDPLKTLKNIDRELPVADLEGLFQLLAERLGYVKTEATLTGNPSPKRPIPETGPWLQVNTFARNGLECNQADEVEMLIRVKAEGE